MNDAAPPPDLQISRSTIEQLVGRSVDDLPLYRRALTHRSVLRVQPDSRRETLQSNERLEYLGDAFLDLVVGEALYYRFPDMDEGELTRLRARLVSEGPLATAARRMNLGAHLLMSENAVRNEGRENPSILADAFEALVGAIYRDQGYPAARAFVRKRLIGGFDLAEVAARDDNYKSQLLERMQAEGRSQPTYHVVREEGPSHDKTFTVEVRVGETAYARGTAGSKQDAEQEAARRTLDQMARSDSL